MEENPFSALINMQRNDVNQRQRSVFQTFRISTLSVSYTHLDVYKRQLPGYEQLDDYTVKISLRDDVTFHNGKKMTGESVKKCLERLIQMNDRAPSDLNIESIIAQGQNVTIKSKNKVTVLLNSLADPYGCIIDVDEGLHNGVCIGTGPYKGVSADDNSLSGEAYDNYYGGCLLYTSRCV